MNGLDDLRLKMWQKLDTEGIMHKEFVPPGQIWTENSIAKFWGDWDQNIRHKCPDNWWNNSWGQHHDNALDHVSLIVQQFVASMNTAVFPTHPIHQTSPPVMFSYSQRWNWSSRGNVLTALRDPDLIAECDEDVDTKWLPEMLLILEIPLELLYQCYRGWGWILGWILFSLSGKTTAEELMGTFG